MQILLVLCSITSLFAADSMAEEPIRLPVTKDNSIVMVDGEWDLNAGQQGRIRIKGNQHMVAMAFDASAIAGQRVRKATLVCVKGEQEISGVSISTIATPWDEYRSNGQTAGIMALKTGATREQGFRPSAEATDRHWCFRRLQKSGMVSITGMYRLT